MPRRGYLFIDTNPNIFIFHIRRRAYIELLTLVARWHILGKSSGLKNDCIIYRFIYAWPCRPYVEEMTQICLYFEQAISNYLYTNIVIEQKQTKHTHAQAHDGASSKLASTVTWWWIHMLHKTHHTINHNFVCIFEYK